MKNKIKISKKEQVSFLKEDIKLLNEMTDKINKNPLDLSAMQGAIMRIQDCLTDITHWIIAKQS